MEILLIDNDYCTRKEHHFPNLALMKLSTYNKDKGHNVRLAKINDAGNSLFNTYDKAYIAKVFSDTITPSFIFNDKRNIVGGSGFGFDKAEKLPIEIEHCMPDYSLYNPIISKINKNYIHYYTDYSVGFTTRGCIRKCDFCINRNETNVYKHSDLSEFVDNSRPFIMLLDDNIMAYNGWKKVFEQLNNTGKKFVFKQGMDFRLLTDEKINVLINSNYLNVMHFAFDNIADKELIIKKFEQWTKIKKISSGNMLFYVFAGFDRLGKYDDSFYLRDISEIIERVEILFKYGAYPYLMLHKNISNNPHNQKIQRLRKVLNSPLMINNKTIKAALIQDKKEDIVEWLQKLGYNNFLANGYYSNNERRLSDAVSYACP
jgi:hypothetical protein